MAKGWIKKLALVLLALVFASFIYDIAISNTSKLNSHATQLPIGWKVSCYYSLDSCGSVVTKCEPDGLMGAMEGTITNSFIGFPFTHDRSTACTQDENLLARLLDYVLYLILIVGAVYLISLLYMRLTGKRPSGAKK